MSGGAAEARARGRGVAVETVDAAAWRQACERELATGGRFCGAYAGGEEARRDWSAVVAHGPEVRILRTPAVDPVPSLVDIVPALDWDEREAADRFGIRFSGRPSSRPLLAGDPDDPEAWTVPVRGEGVHQVAVGPIHAGVIESGHFRFHVVGERILHLDLRLFYKHRGLERAAEGRPPEHGIAYAARACGACAVANSLAYAQACEALLRLAPTPSMRRGRTVLAELERLYNHLNDIAAICAGVGFGPGNMAFLALKERALRLNERVGGHRYLFGAVEVGRSRVELAGAVLEGVREELASIASEFVSAWRELSFATSLQARLAGVGVLSHEDARRLGVVGPAARAAGLRVDVRADSTELAYPRDFEPAALEEPSGDVAARFRIRGMEVQANLAILAELLEESIEDGEAAPRGAGAEADAGAAVAVGRVESPRGETVCVLEVAGGGIRRLHLRTASYANWPALAHVCVDELLPDFPLINKSFELCFACTNR